jgi:alpha-ketoglutarate-dependent taurine dioxygenase
VHIVFYTPLTRGFGVTIVGQAGDSITNVETDSVRRFVTEMGAVLLRSFADVTADSFAHFTDAFDVPAEVQARGGSPCRAAAAHTDPALNSKDATNLHAESAILPARPEFLWFCCLTPSRRGGETTLCDGSEVLKALEPDLRKLFEMKRLRYGPSNTPRGIWTQAVGTCDATMAKSLIHDAFTATLDRAHDEVLFAFNERSNLESTYLTSAIVRSPLSERLSFCVGLTGSYADRPVFEDGSDVPQAALDRIRRIENACATAIRWQKGDVLMVDNWRVMHGRRTFDPIDSPVLLHRIGGCRATVSQRVG